MKHIIITTVALLLSVWVFASDEGNVILKKIDANMSSRNQVVESSMTIHGKRSSRTLTSVTYTHGTVESFTEYLSPAREKGTKMLKLVDKLWIYSPSTDRTMQISGHMLRQSVMGSDLSYEDMMDDRMLHDIYECEIIAEENYEGRDVYVLEMKAKVDDTAYNSRKMWVDKQYLVPLREDLFAKSGQILKKNTFSDIQKIGNRWYPIKGNFKDMLKNGKGTDYEVISIKFNQEIPEYLFTKAALKQ